MRKFAPLPDGLSVAKSDRNVNGSSNLKWGGSSLGSKDVKKERSSHTPIQKHNYEPHLIGFQNTGNTCYLAATMQALLGLPLVTRQATDTLELLEISQSPLLRVPVMMPFLYLCRAVKEGQVECANKKLAEIKEDMGKIDKDFLGSRMQDPQEFYGKFFGELSKQFENLPGVTNLVSSTFKYLIKDDLICCYCGISNVTRSCDLQLFLELAEDSSEKVSLQALVNASLAPEERERNCPECPCSQALFHRKISSFPKVLTVCLKRYSCDFARGNLGSKINKPVEIPKTLSIESLSVSEAAETHVNPWSRRVTSGEQRKRSLSLGDEGPVLKRLKKEHLNYQLVSVISHYGETISSGHYIADSYRFGAGEGWYRFDDNLVTPTDISKVMNKWHQSNGYIFYYLQNSEFEQHSLKSLTS